MIGDWHIQEKRLGELAAPIIYFSKYEEGAVGHEWHVWYSYVVLPREDIGTQRRANVDRPQEQMALDRFLAS